MFDGVAARLGKCSSGGDLSTPSGGLSFVPGASLECSRPSLATLGCELPGEEYGVY